MLSYQQLRAEGYTHKGWFGVCPVYLGGHEREDCIKVMPRHRWTVPLFVVSQWFQGAMIYVCSWLNPDYIPCWSFKVTGEICGQ